MQNVDRYLAIVKWARKRYTHNGILTISYRGETVPSRYSQIEDLAAQRYMNLPSHWS